MDIKHPHRSLKRYFLSLSKWSEAECRSDFANGIVVAEILLNYCPQYLRLEAFYTSDTLEKRLDNWVSGRCGLLVSNEVPAIVIMNSRKCPSVRQPLSVDINLMIYSTQEDEYRYFFKYPESRS